MAFKDDDIAEHVSEVFGDIRLGRREGRGENGFRYFRRSQRRDGLWERSERYTIDLPRQPKIPPVVQLIPPLPMRAECVCGRKFAHDKGLRAHIHRQWRLGHDECNPKTSG